MFVIVWLARKLVVIALLLAIPVIAGEFLARKLVGDTVRSAVAARFGGSPQVSFGGTPLLWQLLGGHLDDVTVTDSGASVAGLQPLAVTANFDNVRVSHLIGLHGVIQTTKVAAVLGPADVRDLLATSACVRGLPDGIGAALTADPRVLIPAGHISLFPPHGRAVELRLVPSAVSGALAFHLIGAVVDGAEVSESALEALASQVDCLRPMTGLPFNLRLVSADATAGVVQLGFRGGDAQFQE